jgi:hypothetical protein
VGNSLKIFLSFVSKVSHFSKQQPVQMSDEPADELPHPTPSSATGKHIYFDEEHDDDDVPVQNIIERPVSSTIRVDSSDLISRCKDFIPLLSDAHTTATDKDRLNAMNDNEEFNLPELEDENSNSEKSAKESGEASSSSTEEEAVKKKRKKKKKKKKKKAKTNDTEPHDVPVHNPDVVSAQ